MTGPNGKWSKPLALGVVSLGLITFAMGQTILFAVLGPIGRLIGLSEIQVGSITSISAFTIMLASAFWGRRSNDWGRRVVMVIGLIAYGLTMGGFVYVAWLGMEDIIKPRLAYLLLIAVRLVYAVLSAGIQPAATAYIADMTSGRERTAGLALVGVALAVGSVLGPGLAIFAAFGILVPLLVAGALALVGGWAVFALLPAGPRTPRSREKSALRPWDRRAAPYLALMFALLVVGSSTQLTAAFYIQDMLQITERYATQLVSVAMAVSALAMIAAQGGFVQIFKPSPALLMRGGLLLAVAGFVILVAAKTYALLVTGYVIIGFGTGLLIPAILSAGSLSVGADLQGDIAGLMGAAQAGGFVVGPLVGTALYGISPTMPLQVNAALAALLFLISLVMRYPGAGRPRRRMRYFWSGQPRRSIRFPWRRRHK